MGSLAEGKQTRWPDGPPRGPVGVSCPEQAVGARPAEHTAALGQGEGHMADRQTHNKRQMVRGAAPGSFPAVGTPGNTVHMDLCPGTQTPPSGPDRAPAAGLRVSLACLALVAPMGRGERTEGEWGRRPLRQPPPGSRPSPLPAVCTGLETAEVSAVYHPCPSARMAGRETVSPFPNELDFGGLEELFVALLKPFTDPFVTTDDRERNHAISGKSLKRFGCWVSPIRMRCWG